MDGAETPLSAKPKPPEQIADRDLTSNKNGQVRQKNAPRFGERPAEIRDPRAMMRQMGFEPDKYMTPVQFLLAVANDDLDLVFKRETKRKMTEARGGISLAYRIECAKTAARYIHMEMPKVSITDETGNFGDALQRASSAGVDRVHRRTMIIEEIERISPDMPLAEANYPPHLGIGNRPVVMDNDGVIEGETLNPDGDTGYNPDEDDGN